MRGHPMCVTSELARPAYCCGACPEIDGGGYDCTCRDNPRCLNYRGGSDAAPAAGVPVNFYRNR